MVSMVSRKSLAIVRESLKHIDLSMLYGRTTLLVTRGETKINYADDTNECYGR